MKKTYTSDEIIDLLNQYEDTFTGYSVERVKKYSKTFEQWLKEKEKQSDIELVEGQEIWVRDKLINEDKWYKRYFMKQEKDVIYTKTDTGVIGYWYEYSLTDPNQ